MESPLKERLTGALIVVAVLVIVVPEMLSGPGRHTDDAKSAVGAGPPLRTYSLELGTPAAARTQDQSALTPQSSEPVAPKGQDAAATATPKEPSAPETKQLPETQQQPEMPAQPESRAAPATVAATAAPAAVASPPAAAPPAAAPAVKPVAAKNAWWAQLGSFSSRDNAERLARDLRGKGYSIDVARIKVGAKDLYRVRAGPVADREAAAALQSRLAAAGHKSSLVAP